MSSAERGYTLVDVVVATGLVAVIMAVTVPPVVAGADRARARAAVRYLAAQMTLARAQAVAQGTTVAVRFERDASGIRFSVVADGTNVHGSRAKKGGETAFCAVFQIPVGAFLASTGMAASTPYAAA
jgi:Tfp pilus assembly protein FimT